MGELEISALGTNLGADQDSGSVLLRKPGCVLVALEQGEVFVKQGGRRADLFEQGGLDFLGEFTAVADEEKFFAWLVQDSNEAA